MTRTENLTYRAWPVFLFAFIRLFYVSIFERALQNYLYFTVEINESTLGIISSAGAIAYIFAPLIGQQITKKIGIRNALIISAIGTPILTGAQLIFFEPWYLISCRVMMGLVLGLFWPNCLNLLSKWQMISTPERAKKNLNFFNLSWNFGFIGGLLTGYLWAFVWDDLIALIISFSLSFLLIPISFFLKVPKISKKIDPPLDQAVEKFPPVNVDQDSKVETMMMAFPIIFSWLALVMLSISKSTMMFSYPIFIKAFDSNLSDLTYLVQAGIQLGQISGLVWINSMKPQKRKISLILGVLMITLIALSILIVREILFITIITIATGLFFGLIHGVALKIMLDYGTAKNTTKYSMINEIIIGIGFGTTPIIAGYIAEVDNYLIFMFVVFLGVAIFAYLISQSRKVKWERI
ncbi:MAG: MFS transporter [Candidatus Lokiarchaeota archaeon]|nr:MFS transporter [Candidatus Lokiarchaeota archaeon]